jgi:hypothetical protein
MDELRTMVADAVRCHFEPESSVPIIRMRFHKWNVMSCFSLCLCVSVVDFVFVVNRNAE